VVPLITVGSVILKGDGTILGNGYTIVELLVTVTSNHEITVVVTAGMVIVVVSTEVA
jgi:hypothetical protein